MRALRKFYYEHELLFTKLYYFLTKPYHWNKRNFIQKPSCDRFIAKCDEDKRYSLIHDGEIYDLKLKYKDRYVEDFIRPLIDEHNPQLWFDYYFEAEREASCLCFEGTTEEEYEDEIYDRIKADPGFVDPKTIYGEGIYDMLEDRFEQHSRNWNWADLHRKEVVKKEKIIAWKEEVVYG